MCLPERGNRNSKPFPFFYLLRGFERSKEPYSFCGFSVGYRYMLYSVSFYCDRIIRISGLYNTLRKEYSVFRDDLNYVCIMFLFCKSHDTLLPAFSFVIIRYFNLHIPYPNSEFALSDLSAVLFVQSFRFDLYIKGTAGVHPYISGSCICISHAFFISGKYVLLSDTFSVLQLYGINYVLLYLTTYI